MRPRENHKPAKTRAIEKCHAVPQPKDRVAAYLPCAYHSDRRTWPAL